MVIRGTAACARTLAVLACAAAVALAGCWGGQPSEQQPAGGAQADAQDAQLSAAAAPFIQSSTVTLSQDMLLLLGVEDPVATLESLGCTDVVQNENGDCTAHVTPEVHANIVNVYYQQIKEFYDGLPQNEVYPRVVKCDYDESFATLVFVLDGDALTDEDAVLRDVAGGAAVRYQQMANLPQECTVVLVGSNGEELSSTVYTSV